MPPPSEGSLPSKVVLVFRYKSGKCFTMVVKELHREAWEFTEICFILKGKIRKK